MTDHLRHSGIFPPLELPVRLIGAGGIGAMTAMMLAKMSDGVVYVYDDDRVDEVNIATQFHETADIGRYKADAIAFRAMRQSDSVTFVAVPERYPSSRVTPAWLVISAVDSIQSRKAIWKDLSLVPTWHWYLDARMGAEKFELYCISRDDLDWYAGVLAGQADGDIPDEPCTAKATFYTAAMAAGHIGKSIRMILTNNKPPVWLQHDIIGDRIEVARGYEPQGRKEVVQHS